MGVYANFIDAIGLGGPQEHEACTACWDTGWVTYPVTVMPEVNESDPCPYGCEEQEEPSDPLPTAMVQPWWPSNFERNTTPYGMPYYEQRRRHLKAQSQLVGAWGMQRVRPPGRITTDTDVRGFIRGIECHVPAYLPGTPISEDLWSLEVEYEFLGSKVNVIYLGESKSLFRFAYGFEDGYTTKEIMAS